MTNQDDANKIYKYAKMQSDCTNVHAHRECESNSESPEKQNEQQQRRGREVRDRLNSMCARTHQTNIK